MAADEIVEPKPTLLEHLMEIRGRLIRVALFFFVVSAICYGLSGEIFDALAGPAQGHLVFTHPVGGMMAYLKIAFVAGALWSSPYTVYHMYAFIGPALSPARRRGLVWALLVGYGLFALGAWFGYHALPLAMRALMSFNRPGFRAMIDVDQYFKFVFMLVLGMGAAFETPLLLFYVALGGFISAAALRRQWRLAVLGCLILGAMINPTPDIFSWLLVCAPLFALYGVSVVVVAWAERRRARAQALALKA